MAANDQEPEIAKVAPKKLRKFGSRYQVFDLGTHLMTRGGLTKEDLTLNKFGRIVSKKKQAMAKDSYAKFGFKKRNAPEAKPLEEEKEKPKKTRKRVRKARKKKSEE